MVSDMLAKDFHHAFNNEPLFLDVHYIHCTASI